MNSVDDLYSDPHLAAVGLFEHVAHPTEGEIVTTRFPVNFGASPTALRMAPPNLGEHGVIAAKKAVPETTIS